MLGIVEGYYGAPWDWATRADTVRFLQPHGYGFYIYAPKADEFLRRRWREQHPPETFDALVVLSRRCREANVRFGIGLSPYEIYRGFDSDVKADLKRKLAEIDQYAPSILAILFDDMKGDLPGLAETQCAIAHWIAERTRAEQIVLCPTYYTDDPVLDRVFGQRPEHYLEDIGARLDPKIGVFWTGEEVCSREYSTGHLDRVAAQLRRKPFLWDNYPVNDGPRMSQYLHLRAFTGRPAAMREHIAGHAVNPAVQPVLSRIPMLTLSESYARGDAYEYGAAFARAAETVCGPELAQMLQADLIRLNDIGLDNLGDAIARLRARYGTDSHPAAREVIAFLDGEYCFTGEMS